MIPSTRQRAFALIETIAMVMLLAVFMLVFGALFKAAYLGHRESARRDSLDLRVDAALESLRRDVWSAHALTANNGELTLTMDNQATTRWHFGPTWTRTPAPPPPPPAGPKCPPTPSPSKSAAHSSPSTSSQKQTPRAAKKPPLKPSPSSANSCSQVPNDPLNSVISHKPAPRR